MTCEFLDVRLSIGACRSIITSDQKSSGFIELVQRRVLSWEVD